MGSLSNLYISQSYISLIHLGSDTTITTASVELQDGLGNGLGIFVNSLGQISSSGNIYGANITASVVNTGSLVGTSSFNSYTSSTNSRLSNIESTTASLNQSASLGLVTASFNNTTRNLTFTKGNTTQFSVNIPDVSGSTINTGSFATTGSNTFDGANNFSSSVDILGGLNIYDNGISIGYPKNMGDPFNTNIGVYTPFVYSTTGSLKLSGNTMAQKGVTILYGLGVTGSVVISPLPGMTPTGGDLNVYGTLSSSLQEGYVWVGDSAGRTTTVATSSFGGTLPSGVVSSSAQITALGFVSSSVTASSLVTASFSGNTLTFTKGNGTTFGVLLPDVSGSDISALNAFTSSQLNINSGYNTFTQSIQSQVNNLQSVTGSYTLTSSFNSYTQSNNQRVSSLEANSASVNISISNLNSTTSSINSSITQLNASSASQQISIDSLNSATSSYANSASVAAVDAAQQQSINSLNSVTSSFLTSSTDISQLNAFTASQLNINSGYNSFTSSTNQRLGSLEVNSASVNSSITQLNSSTASQQISIDALNTFSSSQLGKDNTLAVYTGSNDTKWDTLGGQSGSWITESETGSFAYINKDNNWSANQTFTNITAVSASFTYVKTTYETSSVIYSSGSNQFGDELTDIQTLSGSVLIQGSGSINGNRILTTADSSSLNVLSASYASTASEARNLVVIARNANPSTLPAGTVVRITSAVGDNPIFNTASYDNETLSSNTLGILRYSSPTGADVEVVVSGVVTGVNTDPTLGYAAGQVIYLSSSGQFTNVAPQAPLQIVTLGEVLRVQQNNGSIYVNVSNGWELNELHNVQINTPQTGDLLQYESASYGLWKNKSISGAGITTTSSFNAYTSSNDSKVNTLIAATGSYATTGSNLFRGYQDFETSANSAVIKMYQGSVVGGTTSNSLQFHEGSSQNPSSSYYNIQVTPGDSAFLAFTEQPSNVKFIQLIYSSSASSRSVAIDAPITTANGNPVSIFKDTEITGALNVSSTFTSSLSQGYVWVGDSTNKTTLAATSSFITTGTISSSQQILNYGIFATTGSNLFNGGQSFADTFGNVSNLTPYSGSFIFVAKGATSSSAGLSHLTSSAGNQTNLVFKNSNTAADTVISGSNNIFTNPTALTAGFKKYVGNSNIVMTGNLMELTGSAAYSPAVNNNLANNTIRFRGPVSSSAWSFSANYVNGNFFIGNADATSANQAIAGGNMNNNLVFAATIYNAYTTPLSASANYTNNLSIGGVTLTAFSSSIQATNNIFNGNTFTVNNSYYGTSSTAAAQRLALSYNVFGGINSSTLTVSGSNTTAGAPREVIGNTSNGSGILLGAVLSGDNSNLYSTLIHGSNLTVTGSSQYNTYQTAGSTFVGRNNDVSGTKANSAETVFAVGTGTSTSARKTGLLIDSGSNTFIEGTLNVSGATSINGVVNITGSLTASLTEGYVLAGGTGNITKLVATSSFGTPIPTGTVSSSAQILSYGIFATTGSNSFSGSQTITGSINVVSSSYSGQAVTNITPVSSSQQSVLNMVTLTQSEYDLITPNNQTLYIII